ncbi:MAG: hypothetical protein Q4C64_04805 [Erysipelotrichia bacterium]|nr:hypothetical protein [Erysipelotrichia bacterium]
MDKYEYKYQLQEDEILEYYRYSIKHMPTVKKQFLWIDFSIPVLIALALFVFKIYIYLWVDIVAIALIFLWFAIGRSLVKMQFLYLRVDKEFLNKLNIDYHKEVKVCFADSLYVNNQKISYKQLKEIVPLKKNILIAYNENGLLILPLRIIGSQQQAVDLYRFILLKEKEKNESTGNN